MLSMEKVTLVQENSVKNSVKMNIKYKKCLQTLSCAVVIAYFTLLVYQTFGVGGVEVPTNEREDKPYYHDRNLAEDRSQTEIEVPQELTSEFATATATVKPPTITLDDVFISVKTTKNYHVKRLPIILKTWFQLARKQTWFFTDTNDMEFQLKTNMCDPDPPTPKKPAGPPKKPAGPKQPAVFLTCKDFGGIADEQNVKHCIKLFTWVNSSKLQIEVMNYGACITSIKVPDKNKKVRDVVMGFNEANDYRNPENPYFGCTVGRVANRIAKGKMKIEGKEYQLSVNNTPNHLHGGMKGFDKVVWDYSIQKTKLILSYLSPDMEEGYPGALLVNVTFELNDKNEFSISYQAVTTKPTIVNLTNHSYFNLAGDDTGAEEIYKHFVYINANMITAIDDNLIPTGELTPVKDTLFDFTKPVELGPALCKLPNGAGFDHNFCLMSCGGLKQIAAKVKHPESGIILEVYTDQNGIQFYTGNFLPKTDCLKGKNGFIKRQGAFCLETQNYPDAVNQPKFPSPLLYPGKIYKTTTIYKFLVE